VRAFRAAYGVVLDEDGQAMLEAKDGAGCPLLTADRRCAVHPVKPMQCRTWPFWSEMVEDERAWAAAKAFCPGLDAPAGRRYTRPEILKILEEDTGTTDPLAEHRTNV
jgi:Fe-S-cluster containining protein